MLSARAAIWKIMVVLYCYLLVSTRLLILMYISVFLTQCIAYYRDIVYRQYIIGPHLSRQPRFAHISTLTVSS